MSQLGNFKGILSKIKYINNKGETEWSFELPLFHLCYKSIHPAIQNKQNEKTVMYKNTSGLAEIL